MGNTDDWMLLKEEIRCNWEMRLVDMEKNDERTSRVEKKTNNPVFRLVCTVRIN